jgi:hypothetical protein
MSNRSHRRAVHQQSPVQRVLRAIGHNSPFALLAIAATAFIAAVMIACGQSAQAQNSAATPLPSGWIALRSQSPVDVIAAARQSPLFNVNRSGNGDYLSDLSHLGTPLLVQGYSAVAGVTLPDYDIIPVLDAASGSSLGAAVLQLNAAHTAIHVQSIDTFARPRAAGAIAQMNLPRAVSTLTTQSHTQLAFNARPRLVYLNISLQGVDQGTLTWTGGGILPDDPLWLIPGADGHDHIIGNDGHAYLPQQLPPAK